MLNYKRWILHGEGHTSSNNEQNYGNIGYFSMGDDMVGMVQDGTVHPRFGDDGEGVNEEATKFLKLLEEAKKPLFPNCKNFTSLSFTVRMLQLKVINGWTNNSFTSMVMLLKEAFEVLGVILPKNFYEANKITTELGFTYETWDTCPNSCMLFRNADKYLDKCTLCGISRYKQFEGENTSDANLSSKKKKVAAKQ